jgi:hypothetical protein
VSSQPPPGSPTPAGGPPQPPPGYGGPSGYGAGQPGSPPPGYGAPPGYPGYGYADPGAPFGRDPLSGQPLSDKSKLAAGLLELFLGGFGAGRWYLGDTGIALAQLFTCGGLGIWALIDAIMMLTGNVRDRYGRPLRD